MSIGEVLSLLREEFSDITISKIRFLESQGLLDPERTPSGYRKFYDADIDRLRWILRQQREHFLPLKVIKGRLGITEDSAEAAPSPPSPDDRLAAVPGPALSSHTSGQAASDAPVDHLRRTPARAPFVAPEPTIPPAFAARPGNDGEATMTKEELGEASGLVRREIDELEKYGLINGRKVGGTLYYDEEDLLVANLAAGFRRFGVEARHLRMYKSAADREAGVFDQVVLPLVKQRNPQSRKQAVDALSELSRLGSGLRAAMLRQALRDASSG